MTTNAIASKLVFGAIAKAVAPKQSITVSDYSDAHRVLVEGADSEPGQFKTSRNPFMREIMNELSEDSPAEKIVFMGPTQLAKTMISTNWLAYIIGHAKGSVGVYMPTENSLKDWKTQKFTPLTEHTEPVRDALAAKAGNANARQNEYPGGTVFFRTAGSTADLKNLSLRYGIADEVDEYDKDTGQGDVVGLIEARTSIYPDGKLYVCSSPTMKDASIIEDEYLGGDQRQAFMPCPHCGELMQFKWPNLQWQQLPGKHIEFSDVWMVCENNGCVIHEHEKTDMMDNGVWIPQNPGAHYPSFQINALYTPIGLGRSWIKLARQWIEAQADETKAKLMRFINTRLAETYADRRCDINAQTLQERAEPYELRTIPDGVCLLTIGGDNQSGGNSRVELQLLGHGWNKETESVFTCTLDYHTITGMLTDQSTWDAVANYINDIQLQNRFGKTLRVEASAIDIGGHNTHDVYNFIRARKILRGMAIQGAPRPGQQVLGKPRPQDVNWRGKTIKNGVMLYQIGTDTVKDILFGRLEADEEKPANERRIRLSTHLPQEYFSGLVSETYNPKKKKYEKKKGRRNEPLDTWVYAQAAAHHPEIYIHKWRKADWERRLAMLEPVERREELQPDVEPDQHPTIAQDVTPKRRKRKRKRGGNSVTNW